MKTKDRPLGWNNKPIPFGHLYSDYTPEEISKMLGEEDFVNFLKEQEEIENGSSYVE